MKKKLLITTTDSFANGIRIEKYIDLVQSNVVLGANAFSDFKASFTDTFGGFSGTYQRKLKTLREAAIDDITNQALNMGANAIVGLRFDFDEVSGSKNTMFMASVIGTAVKVSMPDTATDPNKGYVQGVYLEDLETEIERRKAISKIDNGEFLTDADWNLLADNPTDDLVDKLLKCYINCREVYSSGTDDAMRNNIIAFLHNADADIVSQAVYKLLPEHCKEMGKIMAAIPMFSPYATLGLLESGCIEAALRSMNSNKNFYSADDIAAMDKIIGRIDNMPDTGSFETKTSGLISKKEIRKYVCPDGHINDEQQEFCTQCGKNIKGLTEYQTRIIAAFKRRTALLKEIIFN